MLTLVLEVRPSENGEQSSLKGRIPEAAIGQGIIARYGTRAGWDGNESPYRLLRHERSALFFIEPILPLHWIIAVVETIVPESCPKQGCHSRCRCDDPR